MKYSNIPDSVIAKYSRILTGIAFTSISMLPLATSVMAQTGPALTATAQTRTHVVPASSEVVYRILVKNTTTSDAYKVKVSSRLPIGFTYKKHLTTLQKGVVKFGKADKFLDPAYTTKPVAGANDLVWDNITIPKGGSVEFIFTANASVTASTTAYSIQDLLVSSYGSATSTAANTIAASVSGTADNVMVKPIPPTPSLSFAPSPNNVYDAPICAQPGAQGVGVELTGIVNTYFKPTLQSVAAGTSSIAIASGAAQGANQDIKKGDLVLIVQMQDASINTTNTEAYGSGNTANQGSGQISMGNSGLYEYAIANSDVSATSGNATLTLRRPLINSYTSANVTTTSGQKRFQVIRVPQYASAKILGTMFATPWDGNVGGILAVDAFGTFDLNGQRLSVNEAGFRGGFGLRNNNLQAQEGFVAKTNVYEMNASGNVAVDSNNAPLSITTSNTLGSGKGEGVAGTPRFISTNTLFNVDPANGKQPVWVGGFSDNKIEGYPGGDTGRGAPANAGGGANAHNAGGGGGGNGGNGGQGSLGYGYNSALKDAGGRPGSSSLTSTPTPMRVFMGGGGGGGEANDSPQGVPGGSGGGIVMLRAGTIINTGSTPGIIYANGANGDRGAFGANPDGGGGGGAGGTVLIQSRNPTSASIQIQAKGGSGGNTERDSFYSYANGTVASAVTLPAAQTNANGYGPDGYLYSNDGRTPHGPGGGGAGGILLYNVTSTATIIPSVTGGVSGLTDDPSPLASLSTLGNKTSHSNGATAGSLGQIVPFTNSDDRFSDLNAQTACSPKNSLSASVLGSSSSVASSGSSGSSGINTAPGETISYKMKLTNSDYGGGATGVSFNYTLPAGFTYASTPNDGVTSSAGVTRTDATNPTVGSTTLTWGTFSIPPGATVEINFNVKIGATVANGVYNSNGLISILDPERTAANSTAKIDLPIIKGPAATVKRTSVPMVWNMSPTIRIVRR